MTNAQVIDRIRDVAQRVLPDGSKLYLYGSRARGDNHEDSDWDLLVLLPDVDMTKDEKLNVSCDFWETGHEINQEFNAFVYTQSEWNSTPPSLFKYYVQNEGIRL